MGKFLLMNEKAQASAPFELFVAVIIMAFVIVVGYTALERVNTEVCINTVEREMTKFKVNLEGTVNLKSQNKIFFSPDDRCFASKQTIMKIETEDDRRVCAARCNYPSDTCFIMTFSNPNISGAFRTKCLDLPNYTNFVIEACGETAELAGEGYTAVDPTKNGQIRSGVYVFSNISPAGKTYPDICVFYKAG